MTITATITRNRKQRAESTWGFRIDVDDQAAGRITIVGAVAASGDDMAFERAGWQAQGIVASILANFPDGNRIAIKHEGLPPHPAAQPPAVLMNSGTATSTPLATESKPRA